MALERDQQGETVIGFKDRGRRLMAGLVAAALLLAGCAPSDTPTAVLPDSGSSGTDAREAYVEEDTLNAFAGNGPTGDYDPFQSPDELATVSELVISGTVAGAREGRALYYPQNDQAEGTTSIVLIVNVTEAVKGKLQPGTDGRAYIEFFQPVQSAGWRTRRRVAPSASSEGGAHLPGAAWWRPDRRLGTRSGYRIRRSSGCWSLNHRKP